MRLAAFVDEAHPEDEVAVVADLDGRSAVSPMVPRRYHYIVSTAKWVVFWVEAGAHDAGTPPGRLKYKRSQPPAQWDPRGGRNRENLQQTRLTSDVVRTF